MVYDFSGYATRNNLKCNDGRVILKDAFKNCDKKKVPLVWNHQHNEPFNVLGHAILENRNDGVYAYCTFNDTEAGLEAKKLVEHGDISSLSIYANNLKEVAKKVSHGVIREVSLVLAGANPGAFIENVINHGLEHDDEVVIYSGDGIYLQHSDESSDDDKKTETSKKDDEEKTLKDVFDEMTDEQKNVVYALVGQAIEDVQNGEIDNDSEEKERGDKMKHNVFENNNKDETIIHADLLNEALVEAKKYGRSLKDTVIAHGIEHIDYLFPEANTLNIPPEFIKRDMGWVPRVIGSVGRTPFSRVKSVFANITADEARAKGYIKGKKKVEEVITTLKRKTEPTTVYKKQKLDRDDIIDIRDFDVVSWIKSEMRMMLDEEIARAILIGDGRSVHSDDKINEQNIRPIWKDDDIFAIKQSVEVSASDTADVKAKKFIRAAIKSRKNYKGSGSPVLFTTDDVLTDCLLMEDTTGRIIYDSVDKLATALRVSEIITVPVMEGAKRTSTEDNKEYTLMGIIVNLQDYNVGADRGGEINMFDDFDIDYNANKYLIETRCSGALVKPMSALVIESVEA